MECQEIEDIISKFETFTQKPTNYLLVQNDIKDEIKSLVKDIYDYTKSEEGASNKVRKNALSELIVEDFDEEQLWQQIELQNVDCWDHFVWEVANCVSSKQDLKFPIETFSNQDEDSEENSIPSDEDSDVSGQEEINKKTNDKRLKPKKNTNKFSKITKTSIVDDDFFKLQEMEKFLIHEEKMDGKPTVQDSDEESINMFEDMDDEDGDEEKGNEMKYSDFFDQNGDEHEDYENSDGSVKGSDSEDNVGDSEMEYEKEETLEKPITKKDKKVTFADVPSDQDSDDNSAAPTIISNGRPKQDEKQSDFELRQQRLQQHITRLEEKTLKEAPWQLKGEVDASKRPQNSLLEEVVDFDLTSRPAPIITEETTETLEDIIMRRIKDKAWDDVERKDKPVDDQLSFRKKEIIDQSKSKQSLAQVYEAEYIKQKQALSGEVEDEKEPESHTQIRDAMNKLFAKLDALCHYHYTPRAPQADVKIISNTPAVSMEEVAPVATSDAALLAPEEVKKKNRGDLMSKDERSQTDKNRERRKKKKLQKSKGRVEKVTDHRNTKKGVESSDKSLKTSKAFFQQLNDDSTSIIKSNNKKNIKNK